MEVLLKCDHRQDGSEILLCFDKLSMRIATEPGDFSQRFSRPHPEPVEGEGEPRTSTRSQIDAAFYEGAAGAV